MCIGEEFLSVPKSVRLRQYEMWERINKHAHRTVIHTYIYEG